MCFICLWYIPSLIVFVPVASSTMSLRSTISRSVRATRSVNALPGSSQSFRSSASRTSQLSARDQSTGSDLEPQASSSNLSAQPTKRYQQHEDETVQEAWKRNMEEVRLWRRNKSAQRTFLSFIPVPIPVHRGVV